MTICLYETSVPIVTHYIVRVVLPFFLIISNIVRQNGRHRLTSETSLWINGRDVPTVGDSEGKRERKEGGGDRSILLPA